jgi:hypothetical protein
MNSVDVFNKVKVSSPADVSKFTRHLAKPPLASAKEAHALAAISAESSNESGSSVGVARFQKNGIEKEE